jgi:hypothetical protein
MPHRNCPPVPIMKMTVSCLFQQGLQPSLVFRAACQRRLEGRNAKKGQAVNPFELIFK